MPTTKTSPPPSAKQITTIYWLSKWGILSTYPLIIFINMLGIPFTSVAIKLAPAIYVNWVIKKHLAHFPNDKKVKQASAINAEQLIVMLAVEVLPLVALLFTSLETAIKVVAPVSVLLGVAAHLAVGVIGRRKLKNCNDALN